MPDAMHFDRSPEGYRAARPPYPAELWGDVVATELVVPGRRALDLGAGTGEATGVLLARGMDVVAVEPGPRLADALAARHPQASVHRMRAEEFEPDAASFDLVVAATSIHWMDLNVALPMVRRALKPDGRLLVWRNVFGDAEAEVTPFRREVARIVARRRAPQREQTESVTATADAIAASGLFAIESTRRYRWSIELTAAQVHGLFSTFSDWSPAEVDEVAGAVTDLGGQVTEHYSSWLLVAARI
ncbi:class I SAM-dependent methyltransferase [Gryllotalpicola protaetiae]|uniref:Class I SAM-dependent methyltransferase n=1 Tax=Gryllotalpicola protaetiae TaxID=2419771 RepID=A0A387BV05_9MICO|nr:class I SAM-dependent methyltransferase [Gryllotalpicola protaetiae]AYG02251.1 class I SAM-dependent methyltransferase [Gryllotalpicola protaetiae]